MYFPIYKNVFVQTTSVFVYISKMYFPNININIYFYKLQNAMLMYYVLYWSWWPGINSYWEGWLAEIITVTNRTVLIFKKLYGWFFYQKPTNLLPWPIELLRKFHWRNLKCGLRNISQYAKLAFSPRLWMKLCEFWATQIPWFWKHIQFCISLVFSFLDKCSM